MYNKARYLILLLVILGMMAFIPACGGGGSSSTPDDGGGGGGGDDDGGDDGTQVQQLVVDPESAANVSMDASLVVIQKTLGIDVSFDDMSVASVNAGKSVAIHDILTGIDCESGDVSILGEERSRTGEHCASIIDVTAEYHDCVQTVEVPGDKYTVMLRGTQDIAIIKGQYECSAPIIQLEVIIYGSTEVVGEETVMITAMHYKTDLDSTTGETSRFGFISAATEKAGEDILCETNVAGGITCEEITEGEDFCSSEEDICTPGEIGDAYCTEWLAQQIYTIAYGAWCDRGCCRVLSSASRGDCWTCAGGRECLNDVDSPYLVYIEDGSPREYQVPLYCHMYNIWQFRECVVDEDCRNGSLCEQDFMGGFCACDIGGLCHDASDEEQFCGPGRNNCCRDGLDNDLDDLTDCEDFAWGPRNTPMDCAFTYPCAHGEICTNDSDDDGDYYNNCADPDCCSDAACSPDAAICVCSGNGYEYHGCDPSDGRMYDPQDPTNRTFLGSDPKSGVVYTCDTWYGNGWTCVEVTPEMGCCAPAE